MRDTINLEIQENRKKLDQELAMSRYELQKGLIEPEEAARNRIAKVHGYNPVVSAIISRKK